MLVSEFVNSLSLGGTEKAACSWAGLLAQRGHPISVVALSDGPRRADLATWGIPLQIPELPENPANVAAALATAQVVHAHAPGFPHQGDLLGTALKLLPHKIPVVQTNIFGQLRNPAEDAWTDFRLFISWTSCVQAARRSGRKLNLAFFRRQSVAVYPVVDPFADVAGGGWRVAGSETQKTGTSLELAARQLRDQLGIPSSAVVYGRFSRPEPNKWTPLVLDAFLAAHRKTPKIRLLLREPPTAVAQHLTSSGLATWFSPPHQEPRTKNQEPTNPSVISHQSSIILLPATADADELTISQLACDVILHTSSIGESFGYGLAEPMALGRPVITNSVPWHDQAQIELVRHGECGLIASTVQSMKAAILRFAASNEWRVACGQSARKHILRVADPQESTDRVEMAMKCAMEDRDNPLAEQDLEKAVKTAEYLDQHQFGHAFEESLWLRGTKAKLQFLRWQRQIRNRLRVP